MSGTNTNSDTIPIWTFGFVMGGLLGMMVGMKTCAEIYRYEAIQAGCARYDPIVGSFSWIQQPMKAEVEK